MLSHHWIPLEQSIVTGRALDLLATHFKMTISDTQVCHHSWLADLDMV